MKRSDAERQKLSAIAFYEKAHIVLTEKEKELMLSCGCAWGCDVCQDICPMNKNAAKTTIEEFKTSPVPLLTSETNLEGRAYAWRGEKVVKRNLSIINQGETADE